MAAGVQSAAVRPEMEETHKEVKDLLLPFCNLCLGYQFPLWRSPLTVETMLWERNTC